MKNPPEEYRQYFLTTEKSIDFLTGGSCSKFYRLRNEAGVFPRKRYGRLGRWYGPEEIVEMAQRLDMMKLFELWERHCDGSPGKLPKAAITETEVCQRLNISRPTLRKYRELLGISPRRKTGSKQNWYLWCEVDRIADLAYTHVDKYHKSPEKRAELMEKQ